MYEYKFVAVPTQFSGWTGKSDPTVYQAAIDEYARQGWRLVQIFIENPAAIPTHYQIIFERPKAS